MLPIPAAAGSLFPVQSQLAAVTLPKYRELLRKLKANSSVEESSSAFQQAKERVLLRLQQRRERARLDPNRAFRRLRDRMLQARLSLRQLKEVQRARLRQYYYDALRGSATALAAGAGGSAAGSNAVAAAAAAADMPDAAAAAAAVGAHDGSARVVEEDGLLDPETVQRTLGPNGLFRTFVIAGVGAACKAFLHGASRTTIQGEDIMRSALERPRGQALITVSNHVGSIDDPLITTAVVPNEYLLRPEALRWTMCATDRCFKSKLLAPFFQAAKVLPVERGAGLAQYGMRVAQSRLAAGDWVHIFPEGTRSRTGKMGPVRKGVGWLVAQCETPPLVVPFVHSGMERVIPKGAKLPQLGQELKVLVGQPVEVADLLATARAEGWSDNQLHVAITDRVGQALYSLKAQLEGLPLEEVVPQRAAAAVTISEETLLPLIEDEMDSMRHRWRDSWQRLGLPSLTHRIQAAVREQAAAAREQAREYAAAAHDLPGLFPGFSSVGAEAEGGTGQAGEGPAGSERPLGSLLRFGGRLAGRCEAGDAPADNALAAAGLERSSSGAAGEAAVAALGGGGRGRQRGAMLRMLRGSVRSRLGAGAASAAGSSSTTTAAGVELSDFSAMGAASVAAEAGGSPQLRALLAVAADYSAERAQRVRQLMGGPAAGMALA